MEYGLVILKPTQFHIVMSLDSHQKLQSIFRLLLESWEMELYPASTKSVENYHFQIKLLSPITVLARNLLFSHVRINQ